MSEHARLSGSRTCYDAGGMTPNLCATRGLHVLGCPGHPFHPDYWPSATDAQRSHAQIEGTKTLYARDVIDGAEMERRIAAALAGDDIHGDPSEP